MAIPILLLVASAVGLISGIDGMSKMDDANKKISKIKKRHELNVSRYESSKCIVELKSDELKKIIGDIQLSFDKYSNLIEQIQGRPEFRFKDNDDINLPQYNFYNIKDISFDGAIFISGLCGGITALLSSIGIGLFAGGLLFNIMGSSINDNIKKAENDMLNAEKKINEVCSFLYDLHLIIEKYLISLNKILNHYKKTLDELEQIIINKKDYEIFNAHEQAVTKNATNFVRVLKFMLSIELVKKTIQNDHITTYTICKNDIKDKIRKSEEMVVNNTISC